MPCGCTTDARLPLLAIVAIRPPWRSVHIEGRFPLAHVQSGCERLTLRDASKPYRRVWLRNRMRNGEGKR